MVYIDVSLFGHREFSAEILRVSHRAGDLNPVYRSTIERIREINADQILSQGARSGDFFASLAPDTIIQKAAAGMERPATAMYATGALYEAMTSSGSPNQEVIYGGTWASWRITGQPGKIGPIHLAGAPSRNLPARKFWALTAKDGDDIVKEWQRYLFTGEIGNFMHI